MRRFCNIYAHYEYTITLINYLVSVNIMNFVPCIVARTSGDSRYKDLQLSHINKILDAYIFFS